MTLAQLKRDADAGILYLELLERGIQVGNEIPERLRGIARVTRSYSNGVYMQRCEGGESALEIRYASLIDYSNDHLTVYDAGVRSPTREELSVLAEYERLKSENTFSAKINANTFINNSKYPWMRGLKEVRGKYYMPQHNLIRDSKIKGKVALKYKVYRKIGVIS